MTVTVYLFLLNLFRIYAKIAVNNMAKDADAGVSMVFMETDANLLQVKDACI